MLACRLAHKPGSNSSSESGSSGIAPGGNIAVSASSSDTRPPQTPQTQRLASSTMIDALSHRHGGGAGDGMADSSFLMNRKSSESPIVRCLSLFKLLPDRRHFVDQAEWLRRPAAPIKKQSQRPNVAADGQLRQSAKRLPQIVQRDFLPHRLGSERGHLVKIGAGLAARHASRAQIARLERGHLKMALMVHSLSVLDFNYSPLQRVELSTNGSRLPRSHPRHCHDPPGLGNVAGFHGFKVIFQAFNPASQ
jgi:hypothetical protein